MDFKKLVCTLEQAEKLMELGIGASSHFAYLGREVMPAFNIEDGDAPAWTKEEIDTMLGPGIIKPDFQTPKHNSKASDPLTYPVYFPNVQKTFKTGAQASACALIYLLEKGTINPEDAVERYYKIFS
jgi:hypothetical protein